MQSHARQQQIQSGISTVTSAFGPRGTERALHPTRCNSDARRCIGQKKKRCTGRHVQSDQGHGSNATCMSCGYRITSPHTHLPKQPASQPASQSNIQKHTHSAPTAMLPCNLQICRSIRPGRGVTLEAGGHRAPSSKVRNIVTVAGATRTAIEVRPGGVPLPGGVPPGRCGSNTQRAGGFAEYRLYC
jgi:hypothetical protein